MLKEFCDRCGKEIPRGDREKRYYISVSIYPERCRMAEIKFTLCGDCAKEAGVDETYDLICHQESEMENDKKSIVRHFLDMMKKALSKVGM